MKIDMLMLLYLRFVDFPIVPIRSWSWEYSKDEKKSMSEVPAREIIHKIIKRATK